MMQIGSNVKVPKYHIDSAVITSVYPVEGFYGVTGETSPSGGIIYRNMSFPSEDVMLI